MPRAVTYAEWLGRTFEENCATLRAEYPKGRLPNGYTTSDADLAVLWAAGENAHRIIQARERRAEREPRQSRNRVCSSTGGGDDRDESR